MIKIHICDDNEYELKQIRRGISTANSFVNLEFDYGLVTQNPEELLKYEKNIHTLDIFFLDIDLSHMTLNGLNLAIKIRERFPESFICFVTTHAEMSYLTFKYKVMAFDFILKDSPENMVASYKETLEALNKLINNKTANKNIGSYIEVHSFREKKRVFVSEIIAIETIGNHKVRMHCESQIFDLTRSIASLKKELPSNFYNFHRSYLINLKKIQELKIDTGSIVLSNGIEIFAPSRKKKRIFEEIERYLNSN